MKFLLTTLQKNFGQITDRVRKTEKSIYEMELKLKLGKFKGLSAIPG